MKKPKFFRCTNCLYPSTKPDLEFDDKGVCGACRFREYEKTINWDARKQEFFDLIEKIRPKDRSNYDCIIPVSGGKDSTYQTYIIKELAGFNPLLVSFEPSCPTEIGEQNLQNMVDSFNVDLIQLRKSPTYRKLCRAGFDIVGDHEWPNHVGVYCWPMQMAVKMKVPYAFYGETRGIIGLGRWDSIVEEKEIPREDVEQFIGMNGLRLSDIIDYDSELKLENALPYIYPTKEEVERADVKAFSLGYFFHWDFYENIKINKKYGWKALGTNKEGTFADYEDLDCGFMPYHQYFKFIKYGYARATDHAAHEVRLGRMTKKQAKELIIEYDWKLPREYFKELLEFLWIDEEYFLKTRDKYVNPFLFEIDAKGKFKKMWDENLVLKDFWYESFSV
jgi:N-acetyl sugar amidotransferase